MIEVKIPNPEKSASKSERIHNLTDYARKPELENGKEKCIASGARNFLSDTHSGQKAEMIALAQESVRSKDPVDHWVLSWHGDERPTAAQAREAVEIFVGHLGLSRHQVIWGLHDDTENMHLHIVVNRVHPVTLKVTEVNNGFDWEAAQQAIALIEHRQGWKKEANARYDIENSQPVLSAKGAAKKAERGQRGPGKRVRAMELQTGEKSQQRVAQELASQIISEATSWKELHTRLAAAGVRYEREGSGAKVYVGDSPIGIKASDVDRKASFSQLQKRFGAYQPAKEIQPHEYHHHTKKPDIAASRTPAGDRMRSMSECRMAELGTSGQTKRKGVLHIDARAARRQSNGLRRDARRTAGQSNGLDPQPLAPDQTGWHEYRKIRDEQRAAKEAEKLALQKRQEHERKQLAAELKAERQAYLRGDWRSKGVLRNALQSVLATQQAAKKLALAEMQREERKALRERYAPLPMYRQWQAQPQIVSINVRPRHEQQAEREKLSDVLRDLNHTIDKCGYVTYRADGKNLFRDEGRCLSVLDPKSDKSIAAALATARSKFGNTLTITGSDDFKRKVVAVAVNYNLGVRFSDPALNQLREQMHVEQQKARRDELMRGNWKGKDDVPNTIRSVIAAEQTVEHATCWEKSEELEGRKSIRRQKDQTKEQPRQERDRSTGSDLDI